MTLLEKLKSKFTGKTYDAETGREVLPVARASRPVGLFEKLFMLLLVVCVLAFGAMSASAQITDPTASTVTTVSTDVGLIVAALAAIIVAFIGLSYLKRLRRG
jgi:amino acid transporter